MLRRPVVCLTLTAVVLCTSIVACNRDPGQAPANARQTVVGTWVSSGVAGLPGGTATLEFAADGTVHARVSDGTRIITDKTSTWRLEPDGRGIFIDSGSIPSTATFDARLLRVTTAGHTETFRRQ